MLQIVGKTVYVLGAGASRHTGAPLLRDFLVTARLLRDRGYPLRYKQSFDNVFDWIDSLRGSSYYVEFDLDNLEHVYSLAEMSKQVGEEKGKQVSLDLRYLVTETLDSCQLRWANGQLQPDGAYSTFVKALDRLNDNRLEHGAGSGAAFEEDCIITFNYDVMLDYAMQFNSLRPNYCLEASAGASRFKLFKLHGSTNWASCRECGVESLQVIPIQITPRTSPAYGALIDLKIVGELLPNIRCKACNKLGTLGPYVIPPTWSKLIGNTPIAKVWASAVDEIRSAFQIIVVGYSMPPTDTFFQYLLTLGLATNPNLFRVVVVNTDDSDVFRERYGSVFSRSLSERGRLKFLTDETFQNFISTYMEKVGSDAEWD